MSAPREYRSTGRQVRAHFDGHEIAGTAGCSVAAALLASGHTSWRTTESGSGRGLFCGIGICFDCIVEIDGESGQRACMIPLQDHMDVRSHGTGTSTGTGSGSCIDTEDRTP